MYFLREKKNKKTSAVNRFHFLTIGLNFKLFSLSFFNTGLLCITIEWNGDKIYLCEICFQILFYVK